MTNNYTQPIRRQKALTRTRLSNALALAFVSTLAAPNAWAFEIETGNSDVRVRWDNTFKYSAMQRLKESDSRITAGHNLDDGDNNFSKGLVSNRLDILSEVDVTYKNFGARVSGAGWYDDVYNHSNDNNSPQSANAVSVPHNQFTSATEKLHGRKTELLDAFVFGKFDFENDKAASFRLGRHSLLWGESLFFGANGIAGTQAPVDYIKLLTVPNSQFKEIIRPVGQISGQLQLSPNLSFGAYYQYEWEKNRIPGSGSYLSASDIFDEGGERLLAGAPLMPGGGPAAFYRGSDQEAKDSGQYGLQMRYRPEGRDIEFGVYATRFHDKGFQVYLQPGVGFNPVSGQVGQYNLAYAENIRAYGVSVSTSIGDANVGAEVSVRRNTPLVNPGVIAGATSDNNGNPAYPVGNSAHAQASMIYLLPPSRLWQGGSFLAEIAWNRLTGITKNPQNLDPNTTRDAWAVRMLFEPAYYQVFSGMDIKVPIGFGYNPKGRSSVVSQFNGGQEHGGDFSIGVTGEYEKVWKIGLNYMRFLGTAGGVFDNPNTATPNFSFDQKFKDRDFLSLSVQRTW